jgi:anti-sigma factor RsiW
MKDSEFIELLNLYLDHEISAADAARLEAEVLNNPARRRVYQDYCRMSKACKLLAQDFVEEAAPASGKVIDFATAQRASRTGWIAAGTFAAAAAAIAVVFVNVKREPVMKSDVVVTAPVHADVKIAAPAEAVAVDRAMRTVAMPAGRETAQPVLANALLLTSNKQVPTPPLFVGADANAPQFEWLNTVQVAPMQRESLDEFRSSLRNDTRPAAKRIQDQRPVEWNAIRWEK